MDGTVSTEPLAARPGYRRTFRAADIDDWRDRAACSGMDTNLFYPEKDESNDAAIAVCFGCPVRVTCLTHALTYPETHGVWGGTSEYQRASTRAEIRRGLPFEQALETLLHRANQRRLA